MCAKYCFTRFALSGFSRSISGLFAVLPVPEFVPVHTTPHEEFVGTTGGRVHSICSCTLMGVVILFACASGFCCLRIAIHKIASAIMRIATWIIVVSLFICNNMKGKYRKLHLNIERSN
jgi:ascorbate-specific PTS system EIIC-type component UlaA